MPEEENNEPPSSQRFTNDDFRKLLMTPRSTPSSSILATPASQSSLGRTTTVQDDKTSMRSTVSSSSGIDNARAERRRKKKSYYAGLKRQQDEKMAELSKKYRNRAGERREGQNPDYQPEDPSATASGYRAVAPDVKSSLNAAERRKQMIQESKYLGGDMQHTHLVKGLDYALLQKVRSEIQFKEEEEKDEIEMLAKGSPSNSAAPKNEPKAQPPPDISPYSSGTKNNGDGDDDGMHFKTDLGRRIYEAGFPPKEIVKNDMFFPGRMAYVFELNQSEFCTTLVRSCAEVPAVEIATTLTTNDIVINKLAQILNYLRCGGRHVKKNKKMKKSGQEGGAPQTGNQKKTNVDDSIYGDIGDYVPTATIKESVRKEDKRRPYFDETDLMPAPPPLKLSSDRNGGQDSSTANPSSTSNNMGRKEKNLETKAQQLLTRLTAEPVGYSECYPGLEEMHDTIEDSDEEADYTKMDLGNKKGPVGRWDFDSQEEYGEYMNSKEALPKAAFQFGLKMADGRKTRKNNRERNEKAELDREWQKIQNIIQKRKLPSDYMGEFKKPKY